jgi:nucleoside-triphosphatase THEP1
MQIIERKPLSTIWLKAAVIGSIWASIEIVLGSFLHNLKVPLSGMLLSLISVWLIISFLQIWQENGLVWRAGMICAIMKSISPSAVILGPMLGILSEALLIELFILIPGKNLFGYIIAGAFAVLSALIHKFFSLLIIYGFNFIKIITDLAGYAVKQTGITYLSPGRLLLLITILYSVLGVVGAIAGIYTGKRITQTTGSLNYDSIFRSRADNPLINTTFKSSSPGLFLFLNILSIGLILFFLNNNLNTAAIVSGIFYIIFCRLKYSNSFRRLKKVSFWVGFIIVTMSASFLWNGISQGAFFSTEGLAAGLRMNARAVIILIGFAGISVELRNPVIKSVLYNRGFSSLYQSLNLAFAALPFIISNISEGEKKNNSGISKKSIESLFNKAEILLKIFETEQLNRPAIHIITGGVSEGKTSFVSEVISIIKKESFNVGGFLSVGINENDKRTGFTLHEIESGKDYELCSVKEDEKRDRTGRFYFNKETIAVGNRILSSESLIDKDLIVIDEVGPLELSGKGWSNAIESICNTCSTPHLWTVRRSLTNEISGKWNTGNIYIHDISETSPSEVAERIIDSVNSLK